jgi:hypothetical protein
MAPGRFSQGGFLGEGERLEEVLAADRELVARLEVVAGDLTAPLDRLLAAAEASRFRWAREGAVVLRVVVFRGFQLCPWTPNPPDQCTAGDGVAHASVDWRARNLRRSVALSGPGLAVHLIRDHGFFGGRRMPTRVDPEALARLVELAR